MARVLIAGCGYVGSRLALRLVGEGHTVWGMRRSAAAVMTGVEPLVADLASPDSLADLPAHLDVVVFTAGADAGDVEAYRRAYVDGPSHLIDALRAQNQSPSRLLYASSTRVYGVDDGSEVNDDSPAEPPDPQGETLLAGERVFLDSPWPAGVVRFGGIYGPGRRYFIDMVHSGRATCRESPPQYTNRIHRDDAAGILHHLMGRDDADGTWLGVDTDPAPRCEVFDWIADQLGVPRPPRVSGDTPTRGGNKRCVPTRLLASGYAFIYPTFREGYGEML